jgi:hypothetical protein
MPGIYAAMGGHPTAEDAGSCCSRLSRRSTDELEAMVAMAAREGLPYRIDPVLTPRDDGDRSPLAYALDAPRLHTVMKWLAGQGLLPKAGERTAGGSNCGLGRLTLAVDRGRFVSSGATTPAIRERRLREMWLKSAERQAAAQVAVSANSVFSRSAAGSASRTARPWRSNTRGTPSSPTRAS